MVAGNVISSYNIQNVCGDRKALNLLMYQIIQCEGRRNIKDTELWPEQMRE